MRRNIGPAAAGPAGPAATALHKIFSNATCNSEDWAGMLLVVPQQSPSQWPNSPPNFSAPNISAEKMRIFDFFFLYLEKITSMIHDNFRFIN